MEHKTPAHKGKKMHKMPDGEMMSDAEMRKMMGKKKKKKVY